MKRQDEPYLWLFEKARSWSKEELFNGLMDLAAQLDASTIQDSFEAKMEEDGYFEEEP